MAEIYKSPGNMPYERNRSGPQDPMSYSEVLEWLSDHREAISGQHIIISGQQEITRRSAG